MGEQMLV